MVGVLVLGPQNLAGLNVGRDAEAHTFGSVVLAVAVPEGNIYNIFRIPTSRRSPPSHSGQLASYFKGLTLNKGFFDQIAPYLPFKLSNLFFNKNHDLTTKCIFLCYGSRGLVRSL